MRASLLIAGFASASAVISIGCIGDSITAGVCSTPKTNGYPTVLQGLLGSGYKVTNLGNSGKTMLKYGGPGDSSYWNQTTWPTAQKLNADIYTILLGTNDAKTFNWFPCTGPNGYSNCSWVGGDNYTADYLDMISILKAQPAKPRVFVMSPPPLYPPNPYSMNKTVINGVLPWLLPQIAAGSAAEPGVIDIFDALGGAGLTQPNITCDGCHPTDAGYVEIAKTIYAVIAGLREAEEPGWPAPAPAELGFEEMRASLPRPEWNRRHPELFSQRPDFDPAAFDVPPRHQAPHNGHKLHKGGKGVAAVRGWRVREV